MTTDHSDKYDDDVYSRAELETLASRPGPLVDASFHGDRPLDYYLGFLRAWTMLPALDRLKPIEKQQRLEDIRAHAACVALTRHVDVEPIDWVETHAPALIRPQLEKTWGEVTGCLESECPSATIAMCGKVLEQLLWALLEEEAPDAIEEAQKSKWGLDALFNRVKSRLGALKPNLEAVSKYRHASVHWQSEYTPSMSDASHAVDATRKIIMRAWRPLRARRRSQVR